MSSRSTRIAEVSRAAELRDTHAQRRADGSFYTADDVARWMARRAVSAWLLEQLGTDRAAVDEALADGRDLVWLVRARIAGNPGRAAQAARLVQRVRVLDPTCGAGSFLLAAWEVLTELAHLIDPTGGTLPHAAQLHGIDRDPGAIDAAREVLELTTGNGEAVRLLCADACNLTMVPSIDVVLGNPPYVRTTQRGAGVTGTVPNVSAHVVERALDALAPGGRAAFVLPISTVCTDAFAPARAHWMQRCNVIHAAHFDTIPATLFPGVVQRLTILEGRLRSEADRAPTTWWTSPYHRWTSAERDELLDRVRQRRIPHPVEPAWSLPKVGTQLELDLLDVLASHPSAARLHDASNDDPQAQLHYKRRWSYFLLFTDFVPPIWNADGSEREPTEFKTIRARTPVDARVLLAAYSSTLFWWYFAVFTDNRNVNLRDLRSFPIPRLSPAQQQELALLADQLMDVLRACAEVRTCTYQSIGTIRNTYFRQAATRPVLDQIDAVLAQAYGMTEQQLAFVLAFERRFRS